MRKLNVVIADDHPIVLLGLLELIERDGRFHVVGQAVGSEGLVQLLEKQAVDLIVTDFSMPAKSPYGDGLKLVEYLKRHYPSVRILVLTMISSPLILTRLHELGVAGIIQKRHLHNEIEVALNAIIQGMEYQNADATAKSLTDNLLPLNERFATLSPKEHEILRLFVSGQSVTDIARGQNRSSKTISAQKISAMRKLEVTSDQDLITYCLESNIFK
ncbi:response regulator [Pseudomonas psychrophila]|uniref:Two component transcriptional regulator, LuxR family n=1 Tax=Pseudomonas psychrophila TaxID=122355 RepID=A0ABY0W4Y6_9PSED|nr:response regulator [Pseudomonas psychrophila]KAB0491605.1 response regulator [Pseudomonas psychrophila]KMN00716.1 LuxR family transcriptional regulator [Pseudomonas psychrophila]QIE34027.1 response regulator [Pseudomonas psychrophila]WVI96123.1 response regulator [Pseudomonas psychrophila]SDU68070.1 two component transcriptional regulator, LuxR family [Pseudomonas psychrophila]